MQRFIDKQKKEKDMGKLRGRFLNVTDYIIETEPKIK